MLKSDFNQSIVKAYNFLNKLALIREVINPSSLPVSKEFNYTAFSEQCTHQDVFFKGLELTYYNFILIDYSFFQLSLSKEGDNAECRLVYYPNPMSDNGGSKPESPISDLSFYEELFHAGDIDFEQLSQALCEIQINVSSPIIRYDLSYSQFDRLSHPVAHFHLGVNNSSRIATNKVFTPEYFAMFIARTFYFSEWQKVNCELFSLEQEFIKLKNLLNNISDEKYCDMQKGLLNLV